MTTRTVTVQQETEEEVVICDECSLGEDAGEIVTYKVSQADSKNVENVRDYDQLDLHKDCLNDMGVDVPEGMTYKEASKEASVVDMPVILAFNEFALIFGSFSLATGAFAIHFAGVDTFGTLVMGIIAIACGLIAILGARNDAQKTAKELQ